jgi:hypothetical protein
VTELAAAVFGFAVGGFVAEHFLYWIGCLWAATEDYRIAVRYPHLGRPKRLLVFLPLLLLHAGPWALATAVFVIVELFLGQHETWHFWFLGAFVAQIFFVIYATVWITSKRLKSRSAIRNVESTTGKR